MSDAAKSAMRESAPGRGGGAAGMEAKGYSTSFTVDRSPREVFDAINDVRGWWSGQIEGRSDEVGARFTYRYQDLHRSTQTIAELVPERRVVWRISDAKLTFVEKGDEWNGTEVVFDIARKGETTEVRFTHVGLVPGLQCYPACSDGWRHYVQESLRRRLATGRGLPNPREG
jgi:hypothetical protein